MEKSITDGNWKVSYYSEDGQIETHHYEGYSFDFKEDGTVVATKSGSTVTGSWSTSKDSSNDDSVSDVDFTLNSPAINEFDDLSDEWDVISESDSKIELRDVSGGDGSIDELTFSKM
ncbi:MAG: hypothetical protein R3277_05895 [Brumimicrobium sp.]|nr:hypothetical protein [Brumimicrobium sp.]